MNVSAAQLVPLLNPVQLRLISVQPLEGSLPARGGGILLRMSHQAHARSTVHVMLHTFTAANNGTACRIVWVEGTSVVCSAPPGVGTVYVSLIVDGQAAEARLPIAYALPSIVSMQPQLSSCMLQTPMPPWTSHWRWLTLQGRALI